jgi:NDP-hexose-3-ketoreductase
MAATPVRIGVLGCSSVAERRVLPVLERSPRFELVAVASRSEGKASAFAQRFGCSPCGYDDLLASDVEAVYVSLPPALHHSWGRRTLDAGKHLLLDKPFTASFSETEDLVGLATGTSLVAMEGLMYVHHPLHRWLRDVVDSGQLGPLRRIDAWFGFPHRAGSDHRYDPALGGGATLDTLVYPLSFCLRLLGDGPMRWWSVVQDDPGRRVDVRGSLLLSTPCASASIGYGFGMSYRNEVRLWGESGEVTVSRAFSRPPDLAEDVAVVAHGHTVLVPVPAADHFELMLDSFAAKIGGQDRSGVNEGEEILQRMQILSDVRHEHRKDEVRAG